MTTKRPPISDIGGRAVIYVDPAAARQGWRVAGLANAQRFSTRTMVEGYLQCYAAIAGGAAKEPNGLVSESGRGT